MSEYSSKDVGAQLRQAREARGTSLRYIADVTKISVRALEALERNDISRLPGGIFTRAFVRAYAKEVGLDPDAILQAFVARFPQEAAPSIDVQEPEATGGRAEIEHGAQGRRALVGLAVSVGLLVVFFLIFTRLFSKPPSVSPPPPAGGARGAAAREPASGQVPHAAPLSAAPEGAVPSSGRNASEPASVVPASPAQPLDASTPAPSPGPAGGAGEAPRTLRMEITATGTCWIAAILDGDRTFTRLLTAGERATLGADREIAIRVGDAGAFSFTLNGMPGRPLGSRGVVVDERIDAANYERYLMR